MLLEKCYVSFKSLTIGVVAGISGLTIVATSQAGEQHANEVVPAHERTLVKGQLDGPRENKGIENVKVLGTMSLSQEFSSSEGRELRAREITLAPGGVVAVHQHDSRPGVAYILEGEVVEHRSDAKAPILRKVGEVSFEKTGVTHWWENLSQQKVRAYVVDIVVEQP